MPYQFFTISIHDDSSAWMIVSRKWNIEHYSVGQTFFAVAKSRGERCVIRWGNSLDESSPQIFLY